MQGPGLDLQEQQNANKKNKPETAMQSVTNLYGTILEGRIRKMLEKSMTLEKSMALVPLLSPFHMLQTLCSKNLAAEIPFPVSKMRVTQLPQGLPESVSTS